MRRQVDDVVTYALAAVLTVMWSWATFVYWPPWHRLERFKIVSDDVAVIFKGARTAKPTQIAAQP